MWIVVLQRMAIEFILDVLYFPIWWYTAGAKHTLLRLFAMLKNGNHTLAPGLWLKNIFVPMFGQHDLQGRLMSFFMRFVNVIGRGIALLCYLIFLIALFSAWLLFPVFVMYMLSQSLLSA